MIATRATIWISLAAYTIVVCALAAQSRLSLRERQVFRGAKDDIWLRVIWTIGCIFLLLHLATAFHFIHDWRHASAVAETARQTKDLLGWAFGGGVYFNYLFALAWTGDAAWWWVAPQMHAHRPRWITLLLHGFLFMICFNGAVVFAHGPIRWVGIACTILIAGCVLIGFVRRKPSAGVHSHG